MNQKKVMMSLRLPEDMSLKLGELAAQMGLTKNAFVITILNEKIKACASQ